MKTPLISVIVPIYRVEDYLDRCVKSIVNQTYRNLEIILVDDGSPDRCPRMCDEWEKKDSRIKVIHKENGGLSDARNAGLAIATGEVVAFVDSDDWIVTEMFADMIRRMEADSSDIVSCGVNWVEETGAVIRNVTVKTNEMLDAHSAMYELIHDNKLKQHVWNKLYRSELIRDIPFEKGRYHEDVFWSYQAVGKAERISVMCASYYSYIQRADSIMGENYSEKRLDALDAMKLRCEYIKESFPDLYDDALYVYIGSCYFHLQSALRTGQPKAVINNILERLPYRKTGNPKKNLTLKQKLWYTLFSGFPIWTGKLRNLLKVGY